MKKFDIPTYYKSSFIGKIKELRKEGDPRKKDFSPSELDFGSVKIIIPRHFGFCYGVENAIEISYRAIDENPGKRIFLLSQMIHNPIVNKDLNEKGIEFIMDTFGKQLIPWSALSKEDIIIIPAFGTTLEVESQLLKIGVEIKKYNTTCPFVEKVWKKADKLGEANHTVIIHGKHEHEETRATFSHSRSSAKSIVVKDMEEALLLGSFILKEREMNTFHDLFHGKISEGFDPEKHLERIGVVNQTTMLASETQAIADYFKQVMVKKYGLSQQTFHFADTRDTLCYATNDNQQATYQLLNIHADVAFVIGGFNSSNTSHIAELCEQKLPTFYISSAVDLIDENQVRHFDFHSGNINITKDYLPSKENVRIVITSGASCPDTMVEDVMDKLLGFRKVDFPLLKNKILHSAK